MYTITYLESSERTMAVHRSVACVYPRLKQWFARLPEAETACTRPGSEHFDED